MAAGSKRALSAAAAIASAAAAGMTPVSASASASAVSKRSIARRYAASENTSASGSVVARLSASRSVMVGRHASKKTVSLAPCSRMSCRQRPGSSCSCRASRVSRRASGTSASTGSRLERGIARKVYARAEMTQQAAREQADIDMPGGVVRAGGPHGLELAFAVGLGRQAAEDAVLRHFDHRVVHRRTVAVGDADPQPHRIACEPVCETSVRLRRHREVEERPDRLRAGGDERLVRLHVRASNGVAPSPRRTMSKANPSAHSGCVSARSKRETRRCRARSSGIA